MDGREANCSDKTVAEKSLAMQILFSQPGK